jgi:hypothetical protein
MAVQQAAMESGLFEMQIDVMKKGEGGFSFYDAKPSANPR